MSLEDIFAAIPHRPPFLLVDEIVSQDEKRIVCRKTFQPTEYFYQGHYPNYPITPGVLLCEACMQAGAILLSRHVDPEKPGVPVATRLNEVRFKRIVRPGETIEIEAELTERLADAFYLKGRVRCEGKLCVSLEFACTIATISPRGMI
jgi:3-hydroxyacyl-[acyl-carrier-protein] dehydratase